MSDPRPTKKIVAHTVGAPGRAPKIRKFVRMGPEFWVYEDEHTKRDGQADAQAAIQAVQKGFSSKLVCPGQRHAVRQMDFPARDMWDAANSENDEIHRCSILFIFVATVWATIFLPVQF